MQEVEEDEVGLYDLERYGGGLASSGWTSGSMHSSVQKKLAFSGAVHCNVHDDFLDITSKPTRRLTLRIPRRSSFVDVQSSSAPAMAVLVRGCV